MLATVSQTNSLRASYYYDRALNQKGKGGHVVACNGIPRYSTAAVQLAYLQAYCNQKYQVKAYNIVLSHSSEDKSLLEAKPQKKLKYVNDFLTECKKLGMDLDNVPWVMMEHTNTDCDHYHIIVLTTKFDGSRLDTAFFGKKAAKAAYFASKKNDLHYAKGLERREEARQKHLAEKFGGEVTQSVGLSESQLAKLKKVEKENEAADSRARKTRQERSIAEANARRAKIKSLIESAAKSTMLNSRGMEYFTTCLQLDGMKYGEDDKGNYTVTVNNGKRDVTYKLARLGVNTTLIDTIKANDKYREEEARKAKEQQKAQEEARKVEEAKKAEEIRRRQEEQRRREQERPKFGRGFH